MENLYGLTREEWAYVRAAMRKRPEIERAYLFGSRAEGRHKTYSDVDLALEGPKVDFDVAASLHFELEEEGPAPFLFDVVVLDAAPEIRNEVMRSGRLIYDKTQNLIDDEHAL